MAHKSVTIQKVTRPGCVVCQSANIQYYISFKDPDKPGPYIKLASGASTASPTHSGWACKDHVYEVTGIVLRRAGIEQNEEISQPL